MIINTTTIPDTTSDKLSMAVIRMTQRLLASNEAVIDEEIAEMRRKEAMNCG